jgi:hypothetical protein
VIDHNSMTQKYSTFGAKLLQHTDVLCAIQNEKTFRPITIQIAPTEACDSHCSFCSVALSPKGTIPFESIASGLRDFKALGAKSVEITGGGNPLLYRDGIYTPGDIINVAHDLGYKIGVITNSHLPLRYIQSDKVCWIRVSLSKLEEGISSSDYDLDGLDGKLGLSYIIHSGTTQRTIEQIVTLASRYPSVRFVRIAPDCLGEDSLTIKDKWGWIAEQHPKLFIKDIGDNFKPHTGGCWVGMLRPYWTHTGIYICTSHCLIHRSYNDGWRLCGAHEIEEAWARMNARFQGGLNPYDIDLAGCGNCYYANNNRILDAVISELPDRDFA